MVKRILIICLFFLLIVPALMAIEYQIKLGVQFWSFVLPWPEVEASVLTSPIEKGNLTFQQEFGVKMIFGPLVFHIELINRSWLFQWHPDPPNNSLNTDVRLGLEYFPSLILDYLGEFDFGGEKIIALRLGIASSFLIRESSALKEIFFAPGWYFPFLNLANEDKARFRWPWDPWSWTSAFPFVSLDYTFRWTDL